MALAMSMPPPGPTWPTPAPAPTPNADWAPPAPGTRSWEQGTAPSAFNLAGPPCARCGGGPATDVLLRSNHGFIRMDEHRFASRLCRTCGLGAFRDVTGETLWTGWWGPISPFMNVGHVIANVRTRSRISRLPEPTAPAPRAPTWPRGLPVFLRKGMVPTLGLLLAIVGTVVLITRIPPTLNTEDIGRCALIEGKAPDRRLTGFTTCDGTHTDKVVDIVRDPSACPVDTRDVFKRRDAAVYVCLNGAP